MKHNCDICKYETIKLPLYFRHLETKKHKLNKANLNKIKQETIIQTRDNTLNIIKEEIVSGVIKEVSKKVTNEVKKEVTKNHKETIKQIEEVKKIATKNKNYAKSTLAILNDTYKKNPPLEYPGDRESLTILHTFYKLTVEQSLRTNKLQKAIIRDYKNKKLVDSIIKILTIFLKKDNPHLQSIFNTDSARNNFAAKHKDSWEKDKAGIYLNKKVIKPFCIIIKTLMQNYLKYKFDRSNYQRYKLIHKDDDSEEIFMDKNEPDFENKDDSSDDEKRGIVELEELCDIRQLIKYIETGTLYDEIISRLSPILNYNIKIKK